MVGKLAGVLSEIDPVQMIGSIEEFVNQRHRHNAPLGFLERGRRQRVIELPALDSEQPRNNGKIIFDPVVLRPF